MIVVSSYNVCDMHLKHNESEPSLKPIITDDVKWIIYSIDHGVKHQRIMKLDKAVEEKLPELENRNG